MLLTNLLIKAQKSLIVFFLQNENSNYLLCSVGWIGIPLIVICGVVSGYNGMNLGKCWTMLLERYPEMRNGQERRPYPAIGQKAFGRWMRCGLFEF